MIPNKSPQVGAEQLHQSMALIADLPKLSERVRGIEPPLSALGKSGRSTGLSQISHG
jgi:hypothetical protein